jgi:HlyD family secretion protein
MKDAAREPARVLSLAPVPQPPPQPAHHPGGGGRNWHAWWAGIAAAALVALLGTAIELWRRPAAGQPPVLLLAPLTRGRVVGKLQVPGRIEPTQVATVSAASAGRVVEVMVAPGASVSVGQLLARLDPLAARADLARAESRLVAAEAAAFETEVLFARMERRAQGGPRELDPEPDEQVTQEALAVGEARVARSRVEVIAREADYRLAQQRVRQVAVRSPAAGTILERQVDPGQTVVAGGALFQIAASSARLKLLVNVPERQMKQLQLGARARFEVAAWPGRTFQARIQELGRLRGPDEGRHLPVTLEPDGDSAGLEIGMTAQVVLGLGPEGAVWRAPLAALTFAPSGDRAALDEPGVYLAAGEGAAAFRRIPVEVGAVDGSFAEIRAPELREGAAVVVGLGNVKAPDGAGR